MSNRSVCGLFVLSLSILLSLASVSFAAGPPELESLRKTYLDHKEKLDKSYIAQLSVLEENMLSTGNISGAAAVRLERQKLSREMTSASRVQRPESATPKPKPAPAAAVAPAPVPPPKPAPPPVVKKRDPKTHISSKQGLAGAAQFSKNNVYTFNLSSIGSTSSLSFWATGRSSTDTTGFVWLITPDRNRVKIMKWKESFFEKTSEDVSSYKRLDPIKEDISQLVTQPGVYKVEFEWTGGIDPLIIYRVEITS